MGIFKITVIPPFYPQGNFRINDVFIACVVAGAVVDLGERVLVDVQGNQGTILFLLLFQNRSGNRNRSVGSRRFSFKATRQLY